VATAVSNAADPAANADSAPRFLRAVACFAAPVTWITFGFSVRIPQWTLPVSDVEKLSTVRSPSVRGEKTSEQHHGRDWEVDVEEGIAVPRPLEEMLFFG
jgi:hypothetical protein